MVWKGLMEKYKDVLPVTEKTPRLTLLEGNTPLIPLDKLSEQLECEISVKFEGLNPTGSFKDRGMFLAVAKAKEEGAKGVICASTGNTSASAAAYSARAGMDCIIVIPKGKIALGKLAQSVMYGARIFEVDGNFDQALDIVRYTGAHSEYKIVNSINPYRLEGQKTGAYEIVEQLGGTAPDVLCIPVGNAGNISAYWKGFKELRDKRQIAPPEIHGFEAEGAAAIVKNKVIEHPETIATAIRIGNPASWKLAVAAEKESHGEIDYVTDMQILEAYKRIARTEGVFAEPASCASIAGLIKHISAGKIKKGSKIVCILTGNGLKDPATAMDTLTIEPTEIGAEKSAVVDSLRQVAK
ncbi:threonine synthase [Sporolactobacillus sp. Y61]|jgi:threonine synthase|uniref:Threonine synthase n=1 Tax=Sporolactobacillus sp. Y61 TaxID=3160863 RepID=A0AAU8ICG0_9BACL|nr:threonine synthase [Sporolactobacillus sp. THM19-2]RYL93565.1 threonine synthase [Sporolactobacillus sp. THM19-2]